MTEAINTAEKQISQTMNVLHNRLTSSLNSATNISIADMAEEVTNFTRIQLLQQAGVIRLTQADTSNINILKLLR